MKNWSEIFKRAELEKWAVPHFNISNLEQLRAIITSCVKLKSPVMIGTSEGERRFIGGRQAVALLRAFREETGIPIILNADHHKSFEAVKEAVDAGYDSILFDGSALSFEENVKTTLRVMEYAKSKNPEITVEGELGYLRGSSEILNEKIKLEASDFTNPDQAREFVNLTGVNRLAIAVGNIHGISLDEPMLDFERIRAIHEKNIDTILVLHGGSGISDGDLKKAINVGIRNVHINTEVRAAYTNALRKSLVNHPDDVTPYKIFPPVSEAVQALVEKKLVAFGSINKI
ncbi:hypothetical protein A2833_01140 [Candidatus Azambacteria bacterium RIFCSPHIGHO2_01_FULL_44_55]|uniref:Tagatose-bisphosphate aldolase n=1 Tax=Candidatus Azambacteria bacterium RIFCSPLOWO2_02_FULL_44_14 TaxID=1797306 RepID=A0A1F5C9V3_9BACT|nr:MAG: hypothetical protein A3A18_02075 [Candidatus Azambacteria bacterium RIFCSPLOWO2_01_FULL_44_84]OGD33117.1 MAG: hypothetical protein A3C78_02515 [Candidatus Azambacteria bacterium RIFCSPHIGHO2_02_FULL_45_18]OGD39639.1 MAG: hypothetical protein A3I30_04050 [Candidatus Azambacteria bacterium RIFCSPLOWO2_02_FULL_44_14]OGD40841.1 MAG: hypothetical protein A2833_01140 [Candidatus Azambacteria bacterium RIFCSPHIGHO2_01_FULL_44_55]OGD51949.1 MAG: hypothetical protein A2608_02330 [Candidatus Azam